MSLSAELAATQKKAQLECHVISRELGPTINPHERKIVNAKLTGVNNFNNLLSAVLVCRSISFQCAPRFETERHYGKDDRIKKRAIRWVERAINEDGRRGRWAMLPHQSGKWLRTSGARHLPLFSPFLGLGGPFFKLPVYLLYDIAKHRNSRGHQASD